jgi:excisionase family DNA binding protein
MYDMPRRKQKYVDQERQALVMPKPAAIAPGVSPEYLNVEQAAVYLGSTVWTIRGLIETRKIQAKKIGRRFIVRRVDLDSCWQQAEAA